MKRFLSDQAIRSFAFVLLATGVFMAWIILLIVSIGLFCYATSPDLSKKSLVPTETITRFTVEIEDRDAARKMSRVVECLRHEHHVQQTSSTAC